MAKRKRSCLSQYHLAKWLGGEEETQVSAKHLLQGFDSPPSLNDIWLRGTGFRSHIPTKSETYFWDKTAMRRFDSGTRLHFFGGVAEWLNAQVLKTCVAETSSRVRISPPPPRKKFCRKAKF